MTLVEDVFLPCIIVCRSEPPPCYYKAVNRCGGIDSTMAMNLCSVNSLNTSKVYKLVLTGGPCGGKTTGQFEKYSQYAPQKCR
ncbi:hypothetical protein RB195_024658 [Necator americanus]|uniref:Uncharacterized protein n=1 Tax=Necator americanus TaxID=51031 RepID=A0ABR1EP29_NECAM